LGHPLKDLFDIFYSKHRLVKLKLSYGWYSSKQLLPNASVKGNKPSEFTVNLKVLVIQDLLSRNLLNYFKVMSLLTVGTV
jgi:hypothetical protein